MAIVFEIALNGNYLNTLTASDFVFGESTQQDILYLPTLGQSNARLLRMTEDDNQSGTSMLVNDLDRYTPPMTCAASSPMPMATASTSRWAAARSPACRRSAPRNSSCAGG
ncbi:hypothetical protein ACFS4T_17360 [Pseudomonas lini]